MIWDTGEIIKKISLHEGKIILEAWDSQRKILIVSLAGESVESFALKFKSDEEITNFIDFLRKNDNVDRGQVERLENMLNA